MHSSPSPVSTQPTPYPPTLSRLQPSSPPFLTIPHTLFNILQNRPSYFLPLRFLPSFALPGFLRRAPLALQQRPMLVPPISNPIIPCLFGETSLVKLQLKSRRPPTATASITRSPRLHARIEDFRITINRSYIYWQIPEVRYPDIS